MKLLVNYANASFRASQRLNSSTGIECGRFDRVASYGPSHIDRGFADNHRRILRTRKGNGLWLWKPYVLRQSLASLRDGDYLFYSDSGAKFVAPIDPLIELMAREDLDLLPFELQQKRRAWRNRQSR